MYNHLRSYFQNTFTLIRIEGVSVIYQCDDDASIIIKGNLYQKSNLIINMKLEDILIEITNVVKIL